MKLNIPDNIAAITPYPPGKPIDELEREYGITGSIKLASNENPWGPSPAVRAALHEELVNLNRYPDGSCYYLTEAVAEKNGVEPAEIVLGNGGARRNRTDDLLHAMGEIHLFDDSRKLNQLERKRS